MTNQKYIRFWKAIKNIDVTNIFLYYKLWGKLLKEHFFNKKKQYAINIYTICNFEKKIIYIFTKFFNTMYDGQL